MEIRSLFRRPPPALAIGTYSMWSWPQTSNGYRSMRWYLEPRTDPSPVGYFWSHQVGFEGGEGGYFGLQTQGADPTGKIAIFSVWAALDAESPEYAAPFGGEGTGMTVRIRYEWVPGRREQLAVREDTGGWWAAEIGDRAVGRIRVAPGIGGLSPTSIMWTERYAPPLHRCADMGHAVARFGTPVADGGVTPKWHRNYLAEHRGCPGSSVTDDGDGVLQVMGGTDS